VKFVVKVTDSYWGDLGLTDPAVTDISFNHWCWLASGHICSNANKRVPLYFWAFLSPSMGQHVTVKPVFSTAAEIIHRPFIQLAVIHGLLTTSALNNGFAAKSQLHCRQWRSVTLCWHRVSGSAGNKSHKKKQLPHIYTKKPDNLKYKDNKSSHSQCQCHYQCQKHL